MPDRKLLMSRGGLRVRVADSLARLIDPRHSWLYQLLMSCNFRLGRIGFGQGNYYMLLGDGDLFSIGFGGLECTPFVLPIF